MEINEALRIWQKEMGAEKPNDFCAYLIANNRVKALENALLLMKRLYPLGAR